MFLGILTKTMIVVCSLNNFSSFPKSIKGKVVLKTENYYYIEVSNKNKTQTINIVIEKNKCKQNL